ncbi:MAG: carbohydrate porin [Chthoniobacter sp.]|nr:carbohydrate porin [Chthoniobacter sp.]
MKFYHLLTVSVLGLATFVSEPARAQAPAKAVRPPEPAGEEPAEYLLGDWGGLRTRWSDRGFDFSVQYVAEVIGNASGGIKRGAIYDGLLTVTGDLNLEKAFGWKGGSFHAGMLFPHGRSLTENYVGDLFVLSNLDASDNVHLFELWLEQSWVAGKFSIRAGQIAVDQEFGFTEQGGLFGSSAFGWFPIAGNNIAAPIYPQGAPGVRLKLQTCEHSYFQVAVADGDVNPDDGAGGESNPHGVKVRFDEGALIIGELGATWERNGRPGSLKLGGWYHTADHPDVRWASNGRSLADPSCSGQPRTHDGNWGIYLAGEQIIWKDTTKGADNPAQVGLFSRLGFAPPDRNTLDFYAEGGVTGTGLIAGRPDDVCGIGVAFGKIGDLRGLGWDHNRFINCHDPVPDYELAIEADYRWKLCPGCTIQPSIQYILHPGGSHGVDDALILGLRTSFDF